MPPNIHELRQNPTLVDPNFNGYKLSLDKIPIIKQELTIQPHRLTPSEEQFSFLHTEMFFLHNFLIKDEWNQNTAYFLDNAGFINRCYYDSSIGYPGKITNVFKISFKEKQNGDYNISFQFLSEKYCILGDGRLELLLIDTGDRFKKCEWKQITKFVIPDQYQGFIIQNARFNIIQGQKTIRCALQHIINNYDSYEVQLILCEIKQHISEKSWEFNIQSIIQGKSSIYFCDWEPSKNNLIISTSKEFKFGSKSENYKEVDTSGDNSLSWSQTDDDITININIEKTSKLEDYQITTTQKSIFVQFKNKILIKAELFEKIESGLTTWSLENEFLRIILIKNKTNLTWPILYQGCPNESEQNVSDPIPINGKTISTIEAQMEECDFPANLTEEEFYIDRFNVDIKEITDRIIIGKNPILFSLYLKPGSVKTIAIRQDVDASLWSLENNEINKQKNEWIWQHERNINAFGYVLASKQQRKFVNCSPDLSYAVVCESYRHIFIYKSNYDTVNEFRNRSVSNFSIGKQHLLTLDNSNEVLGISVENEMIIVLTENSLLFIQIKCPC